MGTWAEGNFDNDSALDLVADIADEVAKEMTPPEEVEDIDLVMGAVAIRMALVQHCHAPRPNAAEIASLKLAVLSVYDEQIDGLEPEPEFKINRRQVISDTFDEFIALL